MELVVFRRADIQPAGNNVAACGIWQFSSEFLRVNYPLYEKKTVEIVYEILF